MISSKTVGELLWLWFGANPRVARQISEALGASDELALKFFAWLGQSPTQQPQSLLSAARFFEAPIEFRLPEGRAHAALDC
jgi:hypothetical protein